MTLQVWKPTFSIPTSHQRAALVLAMALDGNIGINTGMVFCYAATVFVSSIIGILFTHKAKTATQHCPEQMHVYNDGAVRGPDCCCNVFAFSFDWRYWTATIIGLLVRTVIGLASDYSHQRRKKPVQLVAGHRDRDRRSRSFQASAMGC